MDLSYSTVMPPMCFILAALFGALIGWRWRRTGLAIALIASILLYACCTHFVSDRLLAAVENQVPSPSAEELASAQAIAVLSGDVYPGLPGGAPDDVGLQTLARLRLAAALYRRHPLPILVTGAIAAHTRESAAALMAHTLQEDYGIKPTWIEERATTTYENAVYSAAILKTNHIARVIVVTEAWHLPRALWSFVHQGLTAIAAPAERTYPAARLDWHDLEPDYSSFARSFFAFHEMLGLAYYRWRYGETPSSDPAR